MVTVLSVPIVTQALSLALSAAKASRGLAEEGAAEREREGQAGRALDEAAAADRGLERAFLIGVFMAQPSRAARSMARTMRG